MATTLDIVITDAGLQEIINAEHSGTAPVLLTQVGFGSGIYTPTASQTELEHEIKRVETISGGYAGDNILHIQALDGEAGDAYVVNEVGVYTSTGTLFAVYSQALPILHKIADAQIMLAIDIALTGIQPSSVAIGDTNYSLAPATHSIQGVVELATDEEVLAGSDDSKAVTPAGLASAYTGSKTAKGISRLLDVVRLTNWTKIEPESALAAYGWPSGYNTIAYLVSLPNGVIVLALNGNYTGALLYLPDNGSSIIQLITSNSGIGKSILADDKLAVIVNDTIYLFSADNPTAGEYKTYMPFPNTTLYSLAYGDGHYFVGGSGTKACIFIPGNEDDQFLYKEDVTLASSFSATWAAAAYSPKLGAFCAILIDTGGYVYYAKIIPRDTNPVYAYSLSQFSIGITDLYSWWLEWSDLDEIFLLTGRGQSYILVSPDISAWTPMQSDNGCQALTTDTNIILWSYNVCIATEQAAFPPDNISTFVNVGPPGYDEIALPSSAQTPSGAIRSVCFHKGQWLTAWTDNGTAYLAFSSGRYSAR